MRNREECRAGSKYNLMQKTSPLFERIGLWARGKSAGVSETSFCGLQRERGGFGLVGGGGILFEGIRRRISLYGRNIFGQFANLRLTDLTNIIAHLKYVN